jgi:drug/metabolite transporter (DMT)-like permease
VVTALCVATWALVESSSWTLLGQLLLLSTALSWAVLVVARPPQSALGHSWGRRFQLLLVGFGVGALAFWLDGWALPHGETAADTSRDLVLGTWARVHPETFSTGMRYLFYFGLTAAACPWWAMTDRRRRRRFRVSRVLLAGAAAGVLLFLWPWEAASAALGVVPVVIAAISSQIASPWAPVVSSSLPRAARVVGGRRAQRR